MENDVAFKKLHQPPVVQLVVDPLHLFLVLHESVDDRFIALAHVFIQLGHVDLAKHIGADVVADVCIRNFNAVFLDQFVLDQLPFH